MADGDQVQETNTNENENESEPIQITGSVDDAINAPLDGVEDPQVLKKMLKGLRNENKNARLKNKERDEKISEYEKWKQSQMSEAEKLASELEAERKSHRDTLINSLAKEFNIDEEFREFIVGDTKEELRERASKLGKLKGESSNGSKEQPGANLFGGNRGTAVGKDKDGRTITPEDEADWFGHFVENNGRLG